MIRTSMRALQLYRPGDFREAVVPVPVPRADEVLVRALAATVCTSDLADIDHNPFGIALPRVLGHEGTGAVAGVGREVAGLTVGQRVACHPVIPCGRCVSCRRGLEHLCDDMGHLGYDRDGAFAEYYCVRADRVRRVPPELDVAVATLLEPLAVCMEAVHRTRIGEGERVLVAGDGPFGVLIARLAFERRPSQVVLAGGEDFRLRHVPGAATVNVRHSADALQAIMSAANGAGFDVAILAVASESALDLCVRSLRARGRLGLFTAAAKPMPVDLMRVHTRELELLGVCNDENFIDDSARRLADPALDLPSLITHRVPFRQWRHAFDLAANHKHEALKVTILFDGDDAAAGTAP